MNCLHLCSSDLSNVKTKADENNVYLDRKTLHNCRCFLSFVAKQHEEKYLSKKQNRDGSWICLI